MRNHARTLSGVSEGIQTLRKINPFKKWIPQPNSAEKSGASWAQRNWRRIQSSIFGMSFITACVISAWTAQDIVHAQALRELELRRTPTKNTWRHALFSRGFQTPSIPEVLKRASRALPSTQDNPGSVWLSADRDWVAAFQGSSDSDSGAPELYCHLCGKAPPKWEPMGLGWSGFDAVIGKLDATSKSPGQEKIKKPLEKARFRDPREITY